MDEELDALKANDVWTIVVPPKNAHVLHNKWVYKMKTDATGDIERYKARLVVCGNDQSLRDRLQPHLRGGDGFEHGEDDPDAVKTLEGASSTR